MDPATVVVLLAAGWVLWFLQHRSTGPIVGLQGSARPLPVSPGGVQTLPPSTQPLEPVPPSEPAVTYPLPGSVAPPIAYVPPPVPTPLPPTISYVDFVTNVQPLILAGLPNLTYETASEVMYELGVQNLPVNQVIHQTSAGPAVPPPTPVIVPSSSTTPFPVEVVTPAEIAAGLVPSGTLNPNQTIPTGPTSTPYVVIVDPSSDPPSESGV